MSFDLGECGVVGAHNTDTMNVDITILQVIMKPWNVKLTIMIITLILK